MVANFEGGLTADDYDGIDACGLVESIFAQVGTRCLADVFHFGIVDAAQRRRKMFVGACFHFDKDYFAVELGNDVEFQMLVAPVSVEQCVALLCEVATGCRFALSAKYIV